ncbi:MULTISPECIES: curli assembly protein CsgF [Methylorubrum]|uniref:curli assembly protein CsgF n=1 Tax=Methylorubrum TaxID=2282523 RepID=UPI00209E9B03|nr:curli production assembly/transport component CsgF [Methylorubrum zatmanii]MCP1552428.1 curli production assembly/transport component CsgF [Methylorubrum extorquens]MCP1581262.1 curli production assembly/transport component CsgF [Methylorubrum extorquens]
MKTSFLAASALLALSAGPVLAGNLIYQPINPAFGGSPLNGGWLQSEANAQNIPQARDQRLNQIFTSQTGRAGQTLTQGQIFAQQLQSQLFSSLANQITRAIFGENAQQSGTFEFQGTTINFARQGANVRVDIFDGTTTSTVVVPAGP